MPAHVTQFWIDRRPQLMKLVKAGTSLTDIAKFFGCTKGMISSQVFQLRERGLLPQPPSKRTNKLFVFTPAMDRQIIEMRGAGASFDDIAESLNTSRFTLAKRAKQIGAAPPPPVVKVGQLSPKGCPKSRWTEERVLRFLELYKLGTAYKLIAEDLGSVSVSNINTTVARLKAEGRITPVMHASYMLEKARKLSEASRVHAASNPRPKPKKIERPVVLQPKSYDTALAGFTAVAGTGRSLADLRLYDCRWPFECDDGEIRFCGEPATDGSYCVAHGARAFRSHVRPADHDPRGFRDRTWKETRV